MLAELGHLQASDLLWRPGFEGWRTVRSLMGDLTTPPLPPSILQKDRPKQICAKASSLSWSTHRHSGRVDLETFLGRAKQPRNLAGLLAAVILVGALGIAFHKSSLQTHSRRYEIPLPMNLLPFPSNRRNPNPTQLQRML